MTRNSSSLEATELLNWMDQTHIRQPSRAPRICALGRLVQAGGASRERPPASYSLPLVGRRQRQSLRIQIVWAMVNSAGCVVKISFFRAASAPPRRHRTAWGCGPRPSLILSVGAGDPANHAGILSRERCSTGGLGARPGRISVPGIARGVPTPYFRLDAIQ